MNKDNKMSLDAEILETIQKIGSIFQMNGIAAVPISIDLVNPSIDSNMKKIVVMELLIYLEDLFTKHKKKKKENHKYYRYLGHFYGILQENTDNNTLVKHGKVVNG